MGELQARMDHDEFMHWRAFYRREPWGEWRADLRSADQMALLANINRDPKKTNAYSFKTFMRDWWADEEPAKPADGAALLEKFRMLTMPGAHG